MTYIGQAAIVLRTRGLYSAKTIHSTLYEVIETVKKDKDGKPIINKTYNVPEVKIEYVPRDLSDIDLFIIDEARTVPSKMKEDIEKQGKKIIACGDWRQLPPVKDKPAYIRDEDEGEVNVPQYILDQCGSVSERSSSEWLGEFDYTSMSGWMYCVNNAFPNYGASDCKLEDG